MFVTFTAGFLLGMAFKYATHREEIRNLVRLTDRLREIAWKRGKLNGVQEMTMIIPASKEGLPKEPFRAS